MPNKLLRGMRAPALALLGLLLCSTAAGSEPKVWNASEITDALSIQTKPNGIGKAFVTSDGLECGVAAIMTTESAVRLYKAAGDVVATNPGKTAGVKISAAETRACLEAAERMMEALR